MKPRRIPYSEAELRFIESNCALSRRELHAAFAREFKRADVTVDHVKSLCARNGWTTDRERFSAEDDSLLREIYPDTPTVDVARRMGRTVGAVYRRASKLRLEKSEAYLASPAACRLRRGDNVGAAYRFPKGHAPANKGLRRPGWAPGRMKETQFVKGERRGVAVKLYKPIGAERFSKNGYLERKIHDGMPLQSRWRAVHLVRWEEINGHIPKGFALKCLGNKLNTDPSNWELVPRALLPRLNGRYGRDYDNAPPELKQSILAIAKLEHAANEASGLTATQRMIKRRKERDQAERRSRVSA
jgi:hypothetical protein